MFHVKHSTAKPIKIDELSKSIDAIDDLARSSREAQPFTLPRLLDRPLSHHVNQMRPVFGTGVDV